MRHLDTNFLILALERGTPQEKFFRQWIQAGEVIRVSTVVWAEFHCGPLTPDDRILARSLFPNVEPLLPSDGEKGAELFNLTGRRSRSLADCLIAAVAMRCGAQLATGNRHDFLPFVPLGLDLSP